MSRPETRSPSESDLAGESVADFEDVLIARDPGSGAEAIVAVHDSRRGPAFGGIRRRAYPDVTAALRDVLALARAMTWKCAMAELPAGGGKAVILDRPGLDRRAAYALVGDVVGGLGGRFYTGPDAGTTVADLRVVAERTRHCATEGHGDLGGSTARGVFAALRAVAGELGREIGELAVLVQGVGAVGAPLCELLRGAGARLYVSDADAGVAASAAARFDAPMVAPAAVLSTPCDVLMPCAFGGLIDAAAARTLPAAAVCGAANNVLAGPEAGAILHRRGIPVAPDFVANAGGLIHGVTFELRGELPPPARYERIATTVADLLRQSRERDVPPGELALAEARARIARSAEQAD